MSPSIGHPTVLAVGTWTKVTGSRRVTSLLTNRVWFCCLLRPQTRSQRHFPTRVPCSPFALRVCLQALHAATSERKDGFRRTPRRLCFVWIFRASFTCIVLASRAREFAEMLTSQQVGAFFSSPHQLAECCENVGSGRARTYRVLKTIVS